MPNFNVLVIGDIMLDHYTFVSSSRRAEEADIPVWDEVGQEFRPGGAANVACNLKSLGGDEVSVHLAGICSSRHIANALDQAGVLRSHVVGMETMTKRRFVDQTGMFVLRSDNFLRFGSDEERFFEAVLDYSDVQFDAVIFSDYDKGTISPAVVRSLRKRSKIFVVDSKRTDLRLYDGMDILKVNREEFSSQVSSGLYDNVVSLFGHVIVTCGAEGADLIQCERKDSDELHRIDGGFHGRSYTNHTEHFDSHAVKARDVTGCGDTHTAAVTFAYLKTGDVRAAVKFANMAAAKKVQQFGTVAVETKNVL